MTDRIEKTVEINAPVEKVWRALTNHEEFGSWFKVRLDQPFTLGGLSTGQMTYPGYEHLPWEARVEVMDEPRLFSFRWPPYVDDPAVDAASLPWNLVEFRLTPSGDGTRLTITESGFDALPESIREKLFRGNEGGWEEQSRNVKTYAEG
jgi:uncharacterized protein YndB with AHSA1/START domain